MTPPVNNQPEQQDRDRARRLMEGFDPGASPEEADDVLLYYLDAYKKSASLMVSESPSDDIWTSISASIARLRFRKDCTTACPIPVLESGGCSACCITSRAGVPHPSAV